MSIFSLTCRGPAVLFRLTPPEVKSKSMNCVKQLLFNDKNKLQKFVRSTSGIDKTLKFTIASLDLSKQLVGRFFPDSNHLTGLATAHTVFRDARSVIGLSNIFQGSLPSMVKNVKLCNRIVQDIHAGKEVSSTSIHPGSLNYNEIALGRKQQSTKIAENILQFIGSTAFVVTFGAIRPAMLFNRIGHFCSGSQMKPLAQTADYLMCVNHAAGLGGNICSLVFEKKAYMQARRAVVSSPGNTEEARKILEDKHKQAVISSSMGIIEKGLDLTCDGLKLVPACARSVPGEVRAGLGIIIAMIGLWKVWRSS